MVTLVTEASIYKGCSTVLFAYTCSLRPTGQDVGIWKGLLFVGLSYCFRTVCKLYIKFIVIGIDIST